MQRKIFLLDVRYIVVYFCRPILTTALQCGGCKAPLASFGCQGSYTRRSRPRAKQQDLWATNKQSIDKHVIHNIYEGKNIHIYMYIYKQIHVYIYVSIYAQVCMYHDNNCIQVGNPNPCLRRAGLPQVLFWFRQACLTKIRNSQYS